MMCPELMAQPTLIQNNAITIKMYIKEQHFKICSLQSTFQPVALKVFPALPTVMVLSHIPGRLAVSESFPPLIKLYR